MIIQFGRLQTPVFIKKNSSLPLSKLEQTGGDWAHGAHGLWGLMGYGLGVMGQLFTSNWLLRCHCHLNYELFSPSGSEVR